MSAEIGTNMDTTRRLNPPDRGMSPEQALAFLGQCAEDLLQTVPKSAVTPMVEHTKTALLVLRDALNTCERDF